MPHARHGYTLTELLIVLVIVGTLTFFAVPKFAGLRERKDLSSARQEIAAAIATARAAAVQKGRQATVHVSGGSVWVTARISSTGATTTVIPSKPLNTLYSVTITATDTAITFDMRGFATPRLGSTGVFRIRGASRTDSLCVTPAGQIMPRGCVL